MVETFNAWATREPQPAAGTLVQTTDPEVSGGAHPHIGAFEFNLRGTTIRTQAFGNVVYHFQRVLDVIAALDADGRADVDALLARTGGGELMSTGIERRIQSAHYRLLLA